jgi:prepilin peptidase CpaA
MKAEIDVLLAIALAALLAWAVWRDLSSRTISNPLNALVAALALISWYAAGIAPWPDIAAQVVLAIVVFAIFTGAFALGMMGGGDVKLITALALWRVPLLPGEPMFGPVLALLVAMALAGGVLTLAMLALHRWRKAEGRPEIPYGVAIAVGAAASYGERYLNQFS